MNLIEMIRSLYTKSEYSYEKFPYGDYLGLPEYLNIDINKYKNNIPPQEYSNALKIINDSVLKVADVAKKVIENYEKGEIFIHKKDNLHEANLLMLNIDKAFEVLNWKPTLNADEAIKNTVEWYKHFYNQDVNMLDFTIKQIEEFEGKN
jgi:dTDP-D-glucose 4,6-dehydratase